MPFRRLSARLSVRRHRPGYASRFGGLWTDRPEAEREIEDRLARGALDEAAAERLRAWRRDGFVVLERAVAPELADAVRADVEAAWERRDPRLEIELGGVHHPLDPALRALPAKLLDLHVRSEAARRAAFTPALRAFLTLVFGRGVHLFQSLAFERGSQQPIHQDTAYVVVDRPLELAAAWIALEDVAAGSGELEYYVGSHRLPETVFRGGARNWNRERDGDEAHRRYLEGLHEAARAMGLERRSFLPRKGDVLVWSADLAHGGTPVADPARTRRSLVCHYCPADVRPYYAAYRPERRAVREHAPGCTYGSQHYALGDAPPGGDPPA